MKLCTLMLSMVMVFSDWVEGGRRILFVPINMNSHLINFGKLAVEMAKLGDEVSMLVASNNNKAPATIKGFEVLRYKSSFDVAFSNTREVEDMYYKYAMDKSIREFYYWFKTRWEPNSKQETTDLLTNKAMMQSLKDKNFEFVILEPEIGQYTQLIPKLLNVPYAFITLPFVSWYFSTPRLPSTSACFMLGYGDRLSFKQRLASFSFDMYIVYLSSHPPPDEEWSERVRVNFGIELISNVEFMRNASLFLYTEDTVLSFPQATMPGTISISNIVSSQRTFPLPSDLVNFIAKKSTILVSFGSFFSHLPHQQTDKFCKVFTEAKELNFIWKFQNSSVCGKGLSNLLIRSWLPQNDLLPEVKGFITHGGFNSVMEAILHATPLILFPIAVDQPFQATIAQKKEFGISMELSDWTVDELLHNVRVLLKDERYKKSAAYHSNILKHQQLSAAEKVSHAVEGVVRFGDGHLKNSNHLSWYQFFMFDLFLFILVVLLMILFVAATIFYFLFKQILRLTRGMFHGEKIKKQ